MKKDLFLWVFTLCLSVFSSQVLFGQQRTVTGTVTDVQGAPLAGANVSVKNSQIATTTDITGRFSLQLPAGARSLVVTYVGFQQQELQIGTNNAFSVKLSTSSAALSDVVVIGYGTAKRANLT